MARHLIDKRALTLLTMALPNDMYARVDSLTSARDVWLEIDQQMQGGDKALESQKESALNYNNKSTLLQTFKSKNVKINECNRMSYYSNPKLQIKCSRIFIKNNVQLSEPFTSLATHRSFSLVYP
ncbi:hypothetical protein OSB04_024342 [Centaurea solstitialis]|uniref:Uncharacterized protein n=1 Tax=Centaurea solstitialis TaxID=347529 RepID=A0AA38SKX3_9ASTR|nr:hypothetical protein OSB04_024342 [Centaurea solstitialis]